MHTISKYLVCLVLVGGILLLGGPPLARLATGQVHRLLHPALPPWRTMSVLSHVAQVPAVQLLPDLTQQAFIFQLCHLCLTSQFVFFQEVFFIPHNYVHLSHSWKKGHFTALGSSEARKISEEQLVNCFTISEAQQLPRFLVSGPLCSLKSYYRPQSASACVSYTY